MADRPICFVIAPIGKEGSEIRARSDRILKHIISPVADECGYDAIRADKISEAGMITTQVINHILNDAMVVADLTGHNANVFYELAVRHAIRKPYVQMIQKGESIPFDVAGMRTIDVDHTDLDSVAGAKEELKRQMLSTALDGAKLESPISVAIDLDKLRRSDDPEKRQIGDILQGIAELRSLIEKRLPQGDGQVARVRLSADAARRIIEAGQVRLAEDHPRRKVDVMEELQELERRLSTSDIKLDPPHEEE
jgi:hypothetical protein